MDRFLLTGLAVCCWLVVGSARAEQPKPVVVDSTGKFVGDVSGEGLFVIRLKPSRFFVEMDITPERIGAVDYEYFTTTDCSGPVYFYNYQGFERKRLIPRATLDAADPNTILYSDPNGTPAQVKSERRPPEGKVGSTCVATNPFQGVPVQRAGVGQQGFTPPFSVKMQ